MTYGTMVYIYLYLFIYLWENILMDMLDIYIYIHQMKTQRLYSCCSEKAMAIRYMDISLSYRTYNGNIMVPLSVSWEIYIYIYFMGISEGI